MKEKRKAESGKRKADDEVASNTGDCMRMEGLRERTKEYALRIVRMFSHLPKTPEAQVLGKQLLRSGTSVAANFREASRARSENEFIAKLGIVEQELDESQLWLELLVEGSIVPRERLTPLMLETEELLKITVSAIRKTKCKSPAKPQSP